MPAEETSRSELHRHMREGIRAWVRETVADAGNRVARFESTGIAAFLCASAFGGVLASATGMGGIPGAAVAGGFTAVGTGYLATVLTNKAEQLRNRAATAAEIRDELGADLENALAAGDADALALRADIARVLREIGATETCLRAVVDSGSAEAIAVFCSAFEDLGARFTEFGWLLGEVQQSSMLILHELNGQGVTQRMVLDRLGSMEDLLRELAAARCGSGSACCRARSPVTLSRAAGVPHAGFRRVLRPGAVDGATCRSPGPTASGN